jgi:hypothetical protein
MQAPTTPPPAKHATPNITNAIICASRHLHSENRDPLGGHTWGHRSVTPRKLDQKDLTASTAAATATPAAGTTTAGASATAGTVIGTDATATRRRGVRCAISRGCSGAWVIGVGAPVIGASARALGKARCRHRNRQSRSQGQIQKGVLHSLLLHSKGVCTKRIRPRLRCGRRFSIDA